jgi:predicted RNase H-like HicB family nuclease
MSVNAEAQSVEELAARPWSREVVADEDGVFVASVPELEGCFADGDSVEEALANLEQVLREWLELAVEENEAIPEPRRQSSEMYSGRFSVRVPRSLHRTLSERAAAEGSSLNQLVGVLLAAGLSSAAQTTGDASRPGREQTGADLHEDIAADAAAGTRSSIGALKGIATFLRNRGDLNFACLMYGVAAERIAATEGAEVASNELGTAAALARRHSRMRLAEALWRESLRRDPTNLRSSSGLGQLMHHQGRYREAATYLEAPSAIDNYALLFLGWSLLLEGGVSDDHYSTQRGRTSIVKALQEWSYQNRDVSQREAWLRHVRRLVRLGPAWQDEAKELITFANANAGWPKINIGDVAAGPDALTPETHDHTATA